MLQRTDFGYFGTMTPVHVVCLFEASSRNFNYEKKMQTEWQNNFKRIYDHCEGSLKNFQIIFFTVR